MEEHRKLTDSKFLKQFANCTLTPTLFTHEAHLRLAWVNINEYDVNTACISIPNQILKFATKHGDPDKFNKTITIAAIKTVHHFMQKSRSTSFQDFINEFPRLKYNFKELLGYHYSIDIFNSEKAQKQYIEPDLLPF